MYSRGLQEAADHIDLIVTLWMFSACSYRAKYMPRRASTVMHRHSTGRVGDALCRANFCMRAKGAAEGVHSGQNMCNWSHSGQIREVRVFLCRESRETTQRTSILSGRMSINAYTNHKHDYSSLGVVFCAPQSDIVTQGTASRICELLVVVRQVPHAQ